MGLAERDYSRRRSVASGLSAALEWSATTRLIVILCAVVILDAMLTPPWSMMLMSAGGGAPAESPGAILLSFLGPIARWTHFSYATAIEGRQVWRVVTFPIAHTNIWSVMMNAVCLWLFARELAWLIGGRRMLAVFAACSLGAALAYVVLYAFQRGITDGWLPLAGATGGVLGLLVVAACAGPDDDVTVWTTGLVLPRRALAWIAAALVAIVAIKQEPGGASIANLGGAAVGALLLPLVKRWAR